MSKPPPGNDAAAPAAGAIGTTPDIRVLGPGDLPLLRQLNAVFGEAFEDREHYAADPADDDYLMRQVARAHVMALVAIVDGAVVGGLTAYQLDKLERRRSEIYLYDLAVAEPHRRRGIATALIERLRAVAAERGAWVVFVQADHGDDPAVALYTKLGTREDVMHFDIAVDQRRRTTSHPTVASG